MPPFKRLSSVGTTNPMKRYEEVWEEHESGNMKGGKSKMSKIFQITITALSFLAFGGYLLTLIIMAIKKHTQSMVMAQQQGNVIVVSVK